MSSGYSHQDNVYFSHEHESSTAVFRLTPYYVTKTMGLYLERKATPAPHPLKNRSGADTTDTAKRARSYAAK